MNTYLEAGQALVALQSAPPVVAPARDGERNDKRAQAWQVAARTAFASALGEMSLQLRAELAARVLRLTGRAVPDRSLVVDSAARWAMAVLDGVMFQLRGHDLTVVRPCAYCGTGRFESIPITSQNDLGYVLAMWQPCHAECAPTDPADDVSW